MLQDSHCHLYMLSQKELEKALDEASKKEVKQMVSCSTSFKSNKDNLYLAENYLGIKAALGLYPLDAMELTNEEFEIAFSFIKKQALKENVVAIGEVGLDHKFAKDDVEKERQEFIFRRFISLSKELEKPIIVHSRYAQSQVLKVLISEKTKNVLMHSFVDSSKLMKNAAEQGYFVSVGMVVLENKEVQDRVKDFPLENLLLETDSPIRFNHEKAMPGDISRIMKKVAEIKKIPVWQVEEQIEKNFCALFN
jgi:TatD DNase family protein